MKYKTKIKIFLLVAIIHVISYTFIFISNNNVYMQLIESPRSGIVMPIWLVIELAIFIFLLAIWFIVYELINVVKYYYIQKR